MYSSRARGRVGTQHRDIMVKSQSAMEYLMTYGWAILIIAVVLSVLFQLGVFSSGNFQPHAQAGSCQVSRTAAGVSLEGQCNGLLPEFAGTTTNTLGYMTANMLSSQSSTSAGTITFWLNPVNPGDTTPAVTQLAFSNDFSVNTYIPGYYNDPTGLTVYTLNSIGQNIGQGVIAIGNNAWVQVSITFSGTTVLAYVNGANPTTISTSQSIGSFYFTRLLAGGFNGQMSNVELYNTSLSSSEVQALYLEGIGGTPIRPQNLVGWWPLNGNMNDYSGNGNNGASYGITYTSSWENGYAAP